MSGVVGVVCVVVKCVCGVGVVEVVVLLLTTLALQRGQGDLTAWSIPVLLVVSLLFPI